MIAQSKKSNKTPYKILFACALGLICLSIGFAAFQKSPWVVPLAAKDLKNPLAPSQVNLTVARQIYDARCVNCHGDTGKGDGSEAMMYDPQPADLSDAEKMSKVTDGEIYYQITEGRKPMPSFKNRLSESERWQLVVLVRSFAGNSGTPAPGNEPKPKPDAPKASAPRR
jgi:mono/diheme cytochrome c family protein